MALNADEWPIRKEDFEDFVIRGKKLAIMLFVNVSQILDAERITVMGDFRVEGGWQGKVDVIMDTVVLLARCSCWVARSSLMVGPPKL